MKEKYQSLSPFLQASFLLLIGAVSVVLLSVIISIIISVLYPEMPTNDISIQLSSYPVQYMLIQFLPFQLGFLLIPALLYIKLEPDEENLIRKPQFQFIVWSVLLFTCAFFLLPFFNEINIQLIQSLGVFDELLAQKESSDRMLKSLVGPVGSTSFIIAVLIIGVITGIAEELAFRRFLFHHILKNNKKVMPSILISAVVFAVLHFNYIQIIPLLVFGVALGLMYYVSGSIIPGIVVHALNNILNVYWLSEDTFPTWMMEVDLKITIPSTLLLMGLIFYYIRKK